MTVSIELHHADCMEFLPSYPPRSVQLVLADMPYGTTQAKWDSVLPLAALRHQLHRICTGAVVLTAACPFDKVLGVSNIANLKHEWIWEKTNATGHMNVKKAPMNVKKAPMKAHETVLVFAEGRYTYNPVKTQGHVRKTSTRTYSDYSCELYGSQTTQPLKYDSTERYPRSVQVFSSDKQRGAKHPTQKPLALMEYLVQTYSNPSDKVLDFCMGSGTTGVAAVKLGRSFVGVEKDEAFCESACERISSFLS